MLDGDQDRKAEGQTFQQVNKDSVYNRGKNQQLKSNSSYMEYHQIQRSTYLSQDIERKSHNEKQQETKDKLIYTSHYEISQETPLNITKSQILRKAQDIKDKEGEQYESISQDRSEEDNNLPIIIGTKQTQRVTQQRLSINMDERKDYYSIKKVSPKDAVSDINPLIDKASSSTRIKSSLNLNYIQSSAPLNQNHQKQIHTNDDLKYPSLKKYESQFRSSSISNNDQKLEISHIINPLKSDNKNYALTMKKITSNQESPIKRSQSFDSNNMVKTSSHQEKSQSIKHSHTQDDIKKSKQTLGKKKSTHMKIQEPTEPNLFYISMSGKEMYPSLDLKKQSPCKDQENKSQKRGLQIVPQKMKNNTTRMSSSRKDSQQAVLDPSLPCLIRISQYRSEYFLKVETQVFTIQVEYPPKEQEIQLKSMNPKTVTDSQQSRKGQMYEIQRRFSDFVFLYDSILTNHLGYIIYPFPQKSLESFVKIKLQSLIGNTIITDPASEHEAEKMQLIQRRIEQLEKFVNFLLRHSQLKYSEELAIFLTPDIQLYNRSKQRIAKYIQEYKQLESSGNLIEEGKKNIKKVIETGYGMVMKWWSSSEPKTGEITKSAQINASKIKSTNLSIPISSEHQLQQQFNQYSLMIQTCYSKYHMLQKSFMKLSETYKKILIFKDIDTEFDYLMKLCAKMSSGKEYTKNIGELIDVEVLKDIEAGRRWLEQTKTQLNKRQELIQLIEQLQATLGFNNDLSAKISKLQRRLQRFEKNFRFGLNDLIEQCQNIFQSSKAKFMKEWQSHCTNMRKIWK